MPRLRLCAALVAALLYTQPSSAADYGVRKGALGDQVTAAGAAVEKAFARRMAALDPGTLQQPSALEPVDLFSSWGFRPRAVAGHDYLVTGVDDNTSALCLRTQVTSAEQWNEVLVALSRKGYGPADSACDSLDRYAYAPLTYPASIAGRKLLDRRDVPVKTVVPVYPALSGLDAEAVTRPGLTLPATAGAPGGYSAITVFNPFTLLSVGPPPVGLTLNLTSITAREGFDVQHNCSFIFPDSSCTIFVRYGGQHGKAFVGSLQLSFSNGARAIVGLLGTTP